MDVFFDTEFTTLPNSHEGYPGLISVGCVAEDDRTFYAELNNTWQLGNCSQFVVETVLPVLQGGEWSMTDAQCALRLKCWIEELTDEEVILRSDNPAIDWPWVEELFQFFGCWPKNLRRKCGSIFLEDEEQHERFIRALEDYWRVPVHSVGQHHALSDAKGLVFAWRSARSVCREQSLDLAGAFVETAYTLEHIEKTIEEEKRLGIRKGPCAFLDDQNSDVMTDQVGKETARMVRSE